MFRKTEAGVGKVRVIIAAASVAAILCAMFVYASPKPLFEKACIPKELRYEEFSAKLDSKGKLTVYNAKTGKIAFVSDSKIYVYDFLLTDFTGDGSCDLLFTLWKRSSFGKSRPFWHKDIEISDFMKSSHLFVYTLKRDAFSPIWCSSALAAPIESISETGKYSDANTPVIYMPARNGKALKIAAYWYWSGWGLRGESEDDRY